MKNLTCFQKCFEDCIEEIITCKPNELCFSVIGFKGNDISNPEIRSANCYPKDSNCKSLNLSVCVAEYEADFPFVRDYLCCCNESMCNRNYELKAIQASKTLLTSTLTNNSIKKDLSFLGLTLTTVILFFIIIFILIFIIVLILLILKYSKKKKNIVGKEQEEDIKKKKNDEINEQTEKFLS
jgi:hypothetical protein